MRSPWESVKLRAGQMWQGPNTGSQAFGCVVRSCGWNEPVTADCDHTSQGSEGPAKLAEIPAEPLWGLLITFLSCMLLSRFSRVRLCATPEMAVHQTSLPWDSPGKNAGVGCHFLLHVYLVFPIVYTSL